MSEYISVSKLPHPIQDQRVADHNRRTVCEVRGYCGPFINIAFYRQFPDPVWHGAGECIVCCNTCNVVQEEEKQRIIGMGYASRVESKEDLPAASEIVVEATDFPGDALIA